MAFALVSILRFSKISYHIFAVLTVNMEATSSTDFRLAPY